MAELEKMDFRSSIDAIRQRLSMNATEPKLAGELEQQRQRELLDKERREWMLGVESYDERWKEKKAIYQEKYPEQLVVTYEGTAISEAVKRNLTKLGLLG